MSLPIDCRRGSWWIGPVRAIVWLAACGVVSMFLNQHSFLVRVGSCVYFVGKSYRVVGGVGCAGILDGIDFSLCALCQPDEPPWFS